MQGVSLVRISAMMATGLLALLGAAHAHAIPMSFNVFFDGSTLGGIGTGSFTFDAEAGQLIDFNFQFGDRAGSLPNQDLSFPLLGGSAASFIFEILSGQDAHPEQCGILVNCTANLIAIQELFRFPSFSRTLGTPLASYEIRDAVTRTPMFAGLLSVQRIPEPSSLLLLGLGLSAVALGRRRRRQPS